MKFDPTSFRAIQDIVLIRPDEENNRPLESQIIYMPEGAREWARSGTVLCIGPGMRLPKTGKLIPATAKPGDRVFYNHNLQQPFPTDDEVLVLTRERELFGIVVGEEVASNA